MTDKTDIAKMFHSSYISLDELLNISGSLFEGFFKADSKYEKKLSALNNNLNKLAVDDQKVEDYLLLKNKVRYLKLKYDVEHAEDPEEIHTNRKYNKLIRLDGHLEPGQREDYLQTYNDSSRSFEDKINELDSEINELIKSNKNVKKANKIFIDITNTRAEAFKVLFKLLYQAEEALYCVEGLMSSFPKEIFSEENTNLPKKILKKYQNIIESKNRLNLTIDYIEKNKERIFFSPESSESDESELCQIAAAEVQRINDYFAFMIVETTNKNLNFKGRTYSADQLIEFILAGKTSDPGDLYG